MANVSIKGLDKADVLCALVNAAKPLGMGFLQDNGKPMTKAEAQEWIDKGRRHDMGMVNRDEKIAFDYVKGRPIKADITGDEFDPWGYDRDQGQGMAERAIAPLRVVEGV